MAKGGNTRRNMKGMAPGKLSTPVKRESRIKKMDAGTRRKMKKLSGLIA